MTGALLTLLLTDVAGSTRLWAAHPEVMLGVMTRHHEIVHAAVVEHGGWRPVDQGEGDAVFAAFDSASSAVEAALRFQRLLAEEPWPDGIVVRDRVGIHVGEVSVHEGNVFGSPVNRAARIRSLGSGGQVLVSAPVYALVRDRLPAGVSVADLGEHRMKDFDRPEQLFQVAGPGMEERFPPLASLNLRRHNLPTQVSAFIGRDAEVAALADLVRRERLVTLLGFGGMGKSRLALQSAADLVVGERFPDGVWFVDLAGTDEPARVPEAIARAVEDSGGPDGTWGAVLEWLTGQRLLLVLDNVEQLLPAVADALADILRVAPGVHLLVTSRTAVRLRGEHVYAVAPLPTPTAAPRDGWSGADVPRLAAVPSVALFVARAAAARADFVLSAEVASAVAAICVLLEGLPLALELAAARSNVLAPEALLFRLERGLTALSGRSADLPSRQRTLRATIAWSMDALDPGLAGLLAGLTVFPGSFTLDAAERVAGDVEFDVLDGVAELVDRSLVVGITDSGRFRLLVPIREYAAEGLTESEHVELVARHLRYYRDLVVLRPDWAKVTQEALHDLLPEDWHNVRRAMDSAARAGRNEDLVDLVLSTFIWMVMSGRFSEAQMLLDQAWDAAERLDRRSTTRVGLARLMVAEQTSETEHAQRLSIGLVERARASADPSLVACALANSSPFAPSAGAGAEMLRESRALLDALPATGVALPRWHVLDDWVRNAARYAAMREDVLAYWRSQAAAARGPERARYRGNLAITLREGGLAEEAVGLMEAYEREDGAPHATVQVRMFGSLEAALCRVALRDPHAARRDLDLAERAAKEIDGRAVAAQLEFTAEVIDRLLGAPDRAEDGLRGILSGTTFADTDQRAAAEWLRSVLRRECGDEDEAALALERAWVALPRDGFHDGALLHCLLEAATQSIDGDPEHACRLITHAQQLRNVMVLAWGVDYDVEGMMARLRTWLGDDRMQAVVAAAEDQPLPDALRRMQNSMRSLPSSAAPRQGSGSA